MKATALLPLDRLIVLQSHGLRNYREQEEITQVVQYQDQIGFIFFNFSPYQDPARRRTVHNGIEQSGVTVVC